MRRRLLLLIAGVAALLVLAVVALPWWLGAAAGRIAPAQGLSFARYERIGYARFALHGAEYNRGPVRVTASRAEASTPLLWAWRHWRGAPDEVRVERWLVEVKPRTTPGPPRREPGWVPLRALLHRIAVHLDRWLKQGVVGPGGVRWPGGGLSLQSARWERSELNVTGLELYGVEADGSATFASGEDLIRVKLRSRQEPAEAVFENRGAAVVGRAEWLGQLASLSAQFHPRGWLPGEAALVAQDWRIPAERLRLGPAYAEVEGKGKVTWSGGTFVANLQARSAPRPGGHAPPLEVLALAQGTPSAVTVEALHVMLPGIEARLSQSVTVDRSGRVVRDGGEARFSLRAELAKQPWFDATGVVVGEAVFVSDVLQESEVAFRVNGDGLSARGVSIARVEAEGRFRWPRVELSRGVMVDGGGEQVEVSGSYEIRQQRLERAVVSGTLSRRALGRWLPAQPRFESIAFRAEAAGPLGELDHRGEARVASFEVNGMNALALTAEWRGRGTAVRQFSAEARAGVTEVRARGAADPDSVHLSELELRREGQPRLRLVQPVRIQWNPGLAIDALQLAGGDARLDARMIWGATGRLAFSARNLPSLWLADLVKWKGPAWSVDLLAFTGRWDRGPVAYTFTIGATVELGEKRTAAVAAASRGDAAGLRIEALRATEGDAVVFNAVGNLPLKLHAGGANWLEVDDRGPLAFDATAAPQSALWPMLARATGIELREPSAEIHLTGTWRRPEGQAILKATRVAFDRARVQRDLPAMEQLAVRLRADPAGVHLEQFSLRVEGQSVRATGRVPVPAGGWKDLVQQPRRIVEQDAVLRLEVPEAEIGGLARFFPGILAPKGRASVDVSYERGAFSGRARLIDATSRPLGPLGVLQEINAEVTLSDRTVHLRSVSARAGGQPVALTGAIDLPAGAAPRFDLALRGENVPFVRQTGLLLRGDLALKLQTPASGPPRITGNVRLRDSLFLQDVRAFLPRGTATGARRPPYFSVDTPPLHTWTLAVAVDGNQFMRLRTTVFSGLASAHFRLGGTLGEPRAFGEVTVDQGVVRMPFASFEVRQASVRLTEANPYEPEIFLRGSARRYGYDLAMEIEGAASAPNVTFTSSPALDSEQVLLMVMTGAAPSNEITYSGTRRVAQIGAFLGQSLLGSFGGDPGDADRLSILSGEKISRQGNETYEVEYRLSDRWRAVGEYNEFDEYNAGVKWRVLPRPGRNAPPEERRNAAR